MKLNKIYQFYGITQANLYAHVKQNLTEAFTGFDGVSFETIEETTETAEDGTITTVPEEFIIYLNSNKSMWLRVYIDTYLKISINFKDGSVNVIGESKAGSGNYIGYNIIRTAYGVAFTNFAVSTSLSNTLITDMDKFNRFFTPGEPNVFVYTIATATSNSSSTTYSDYWYSDLHEIPESFLQVSNLAGNTISVQTTVFNACSMAQVIKCEHLYRLAYNEGKTGKLNVGDKYYMLGCRYALEYDPNDDGKEV